MYNLPNSTAGHFFAMLSYQPRIALLIINLTWIIIFTGCEVSPTINITHVPLPSFRTSDSTPTFTMEVPTITYTSTKELTKTPAPTDTLIGTELVPITETPSPTTTSTDTPTSTQESGVSLITHNSIVFYLTHLGTGGPIGCGDSLVAISTGNTRTGDIEKDIQIAINALFSTGQYSLGFYNATYPSSLRFSGATIENGEAVVDLSGTYVKPGDACDASRYRAQVWTTIQQFPEINRAIPKVRGALLGDLLSVFSDGNK
jgi:hypothetical protein